MPASSCQWATCHSQQSYQTYHKSRLLENFSGFPVATGVSCQHTMGARLSVVRAPPPGLSHATLPHPFCVCSPTAGPNMAPFLRIAFTSYELGSLQTADEASQPFCAVKMKEALSTGRTGKRGPAGGPGGPVLCSPRSSEGSFSSSCSFPCRALSWTQDRRGH